MEKKKKMKYDTPLSRCVVLASGNCLASSVSSDNGLADYYEIIPGSNWEFDD